MDAALFPGWSLDLGEAKARLFQSATEDLTTDADEDNDRSYAMSIAPAEVSVKEERDTGGVCRAAGRAAVLQLVSGKLVVSPKPSCSSYLLFDYLREVLGPHVRRQLGGRLISEPDLFFQETKTFTVPI